MDRFSVWQKMFHHWPEALPRRGVLVTATGEQTPFQEFLTSDDFLLLQRRAPDTVGAREVLIPFGEIVALKVTEVVKPAIYRAAGFKGA